MFLREYACELLYFSYPTGDLSQLQLSEKPNQADSTKSHILKNPDVSEVLANDQTIPQLSESTPEDSTPPSNTILENPQQFSSSKAPEKILSPLKTPPENANDPATSESQNSSFPQTPEKASPPVTPPAEPTSTSAISESSDAPPSGDQTPTPPPISTLTPTFPTITLFTPQHTLESICEGLKNGVYRNVVVMCGAGISVAAGIPDFRTPGTGLYDNLQKYALPDPQAIFTLSFFRANPLPFFSLAKELYPGKVKPTRCHQFIEILARKGILRRCFSQNIDGLERQAGISGDLLMEAHGGFSEAHCIDCQKSFPSEQVKETIFSDKIPRCDCGGLIKPDIVFFGEGLPLRFTTLALTDFPRCDLLIVMGTSLKVSPFCDLVDFVRPHVPRVLVNMEVVGNFEKGRHIETDVCVLGDCQQSILDIIKLCEWENDLNKL